ncbi:hypothetical protein ElyMa_006497100 [Elysia marginata]|uniref:Uncharacterized protein n=1 Tax=Elysia marginata TaxID=1093978 RepID=A0AAV4I2N4_9GAST|nr:hypothetical protein ElyMa_006497100 [Elysia marginata]
MTVLLGIIAAALVGTQVASVKTSCKTSGKEPMSELLVNNSNALVSRSITCTVARLGLLSQVENLTVLTLIVQPSLLPFATLILSWSLPVVVGADSRAWPGLACCSRLERLAVTLDNSAFCVCVLSGTLR